MKLFSNFTQKLLAIGLFTQLSSALNSDEIKIDTFNDFKTLMMYFNEPLLNDASIRDFIIIPGSEKGASFEGANNYIMAKKLAEIIGADRSQSGSVDDVDNVTKIFGKNLEKGRRVMETMALSGKVNIKNNAKNLQIELLKRLEESNSEKKTTVLPFGWGGSAPHSIALIIEKNDIKANTFNLIVVNAGDGLEYHYARKDPNEVYPELNHLWIRFENIPKKEIFSDNNWFMYSLISLRDRDLIKDIESVSGSAKDYFYGTILNNFANYIIIDKNETRLLPSQRSGSCSLSSLTAALLYSTKDLSTFHKNRVIIGHKMLNQFFINYECDSGIKKLI